MLLGNLEAGSFVHLNDPEVSYKKIMETIGSGKPMRLQTAPFLLNGQEPAEHAVDFYVQRVANDNPGPYTHVYGAVRTPDSRIYIADFNYRYPAVGHTALFLRWELKLWDVRDLFGMFVTIPSEGVGAVCQGDFDKDGARIVINTRARCRKGPQGESDAYFLDIALTPKQAQGLRGEIDAALRDLKR